MPSASTVAPVRSAWAPTAPAIAAISGVGCACTSRRSSLMTSGRSKGISASERVSAPMSSSAIPHPRSRADWTAGSNSAKRLVSVRSVSSMMPRMSRPIRGSDSNRAVSGSTFTNNVNGDLIPSWAAPVSAAAWQAASSSASRSSGARPGRGGSGCLQRGALRAASQRLETEQAARLQIEDRLEDRAQQVPFQYLVERHRRRQHYPLLRSITQRGKAETLPAASFVT